MNNYYLGHVNLFTSEFVIGSLPEGTNQLEDIEIFERWTFFKDNDDRMYKFRTSKTNHIEVLHTIDLNLLNELIIDFIKIYKVKYPFAIKKDFVEYYFDHSLHDLNHFINSEFTRYYVHTVIPKRRVYYLFDKRFNEFVDFVIEEQKDIEYYKQYYRKVIQLIDDLEFDNQDLQSTQIRPQKNEIAEEEDTSKRIKQEENILVAEIDPSEIPTVEHTSELKCTLLTHAVQPFFDAIKDFFILEEQPELLSVLETGDKATEKLLFKGDGFRFADSFKQLFESNFYPGSQKKILEKWILENFQFTYENKAKDFKASTLHKYVSTNASNCSNPLIKIVNNEIIKLNDLVKRKIR
jgi:uncharacterized membrane-anchored protein YjiN (DUF445 family)